MKLLGRVRLISLQKQGKGILLDNQLRLSNNQHLLKSYFTSQFIADVGYNSIDYLCSGGHFIYSKGSFDELINYYNVQSSRDLADNILNYLQTFIMGLWLVRDNSVTADQIYIMNQEGKQSVKDLYKL